jgi:hypothetical protein
MTSLNLTLLLKEQKQLAAVGQQNPLCRLFVTVKMLKTGLLAERLLPFCLTRSIKFGLSERLESFFTQ